MAVMAAMASSNSSCETAVKQTYVDYWILVQFNDIYPNIIVSFSLSYRKTVSSYIKNTFHLAYKLSICQFMFYQNIIPVILLLLLNMHFKEMIVSVFVGTFYCFL